MSEDQNALYRKRLASKQREQLLSSIRTEQTSSEETKLDYSKRKRSPLTIKEWNSTNKQHFKALHMKNNQPDYESMLFALDFIGEAMNNEEIMEDFYFEHHMFNRIVLLMNEKRVRKFFSKNQDETEENPSELIITEHELQVLQMEACKVVVKLMGLDVDVGACVEKSEGLSMVESVFNLQVLTKHDFEVCAERMLSVFRLTDNNHLISPIFLVHDLYYEQFTMNYYTFNSISHSNIANNLFLNESCKCLLYVFMRSFKFSEDPKIIVTSFDNLLKNILASDLTEETLSSYTSVHNYIETCMSLMNDSEIKTAIENGLFKVIAKMKFSHITRVNILHIMKKKLGNQFVSNCELLNLCLEDLPPEHSCSNQAYMYSGAEPFEQFLAIPLMELLLELIKKGKTDDINAILNLKSFYHFIHEYANKFNCIPAKLIRFTLDYLKKKGSRKTNAKILKEHEQEVEWLENILSTSIDKYKEKYPKRNITETIFKKKEFGYVGGNEEGYDSEDEESEEEKYELETFLNC